MSLFDLKGPAPDRPTLSIRLVLKDKLGLPIDPSIAWLALQIAFKDHPHLAVYQAEIAPGKE